ncbi:hypothetical protein C1H46_029296 [Malus baccata]|uniref:Uncharacterized protein n=1 Tax=Malus baccata TaxID=106549 RepID=A0A540LFR3_MALBA|nr:hypothetical protein C1H46_029296 [Malus baccata]
MKAIIGTQQSSFGISCCNYIFWQRKSWSIESQEGKNSNLSDASSAKYDIQVEPAL